MQSPSWMPQEHPHRRSCVTTRRRKRGPATQGTARSDHAALGSLLNWYREFHMAKVRCSQERSLRLVFVITTDSGCWINFSLFLSILSYTASQTLFCSNFLVNQPIREKTSQISTRPCQVCSLLAIAPNQHRMMLNNKSALRGWRYPGPWQGSGNIVVYNCKPSVYE